MNWTLVACLAAPLILGGCAQPKVDPAATVAPINTLVSDGSKGTAKITLVAPCYIADMMVPAALKYDTHNVLLDGKTAAQIAGCAYREIPVPAGKHAIRLAERMMPDLGGLFSNGAEFAVPANGHVYFLVLREQAGPSYILVLREVGHAEALSTITQIDRQASKT